MTQSIRAKSVRLDQITKKLSAEDEGIASLEFAILGPVFFALVMVIFDLALFIGTRTIVEDAVETGSRAVRLGILKQADGPEAFREVLCNRILFLKCEKFRFTVDAPANVLRTDDYAPDIDDKGEFEIEIYNPGKSEDIVVVTVIYKHEFIFPYVGRIFGDEGLTGDDAQLVQGFLVFQNEPYPDGT